MKSLVFETPVNSAEELVARIIAAAGEIRNTPEMLSNVRRSMKRRCEACITCGGRHWKALNHAPYTPDLSPRDFHRFRYLKQSLGGKRFSDNKEVKAAVNCCLSNQGLGSNPGEGMDVCKCIAPLRHGDSLTNRRPLLRWEAADHPGVFSLKSGVKPSKIVLYGAQS
ncbi:hypothetical protein TNCV_531661 [Trichonephila clavipes]|nr:hypothetical protein TNCV_531661 [Trichonephila clavipes]